VTELPELDPVIHAAARLKVTATLAALAPGDHITFPRLQKLLAMTAGNLSTHLRKLEDAGYVEVTKTHEGRSPTTYVALTATGRRALEDYIAALRRLLMPSLTAPDDPVRSDPAPGDPAPGADPSTPVRLEVDSEP
jgi:DNA-binding transcriptional ArsR family regulator